METPTAITTRAPRPIPKAPGPNPWWEVDLGKAADIRRNCDRQPHRFQWRSVGRLYFESAVMPSAKRHTRINKPHSRAPSSLSKMASNPPQTLQTKPTAKAKSMEGSSATSHKAMEQLIRLSTKASPARGWASISSSWPTITNIAPEQTCSGHRPRAGEASDGFRCTVLFGLNDDGHIHIQAEEPCPVSSKRSKTPTCCFSSADS